MHINIHVNNQYVNSVANFAVAIQCDICSKMYGWM